jgi:phage FluMu protein Com
MPIRFRCDYCNRLLGIARRKAGTETNCPHCGYTITVPVPDDEAEDSADAQNIDEIDALLNPPMSPPPPPPPKPARPERPQSSTVSPPIPPAPAPAAVSSLSTKTTPSGERPFFEKDIDDVLGKKAGHEKPLPSKPKPPPTSGMDALSLDDRAGHIVISTQKATALAVAVVVLLALSFAAGFLLASR